jgi:hypothetical protein
MTTEGRTSAKWSRWLGAAVALFGLSFAATGCIEDSDCGICDPDNLVLESISGINYAQRKVHVLNPTCEGENCPAPFDKGSYFIEDIGPCEETDEALASARGPEEFCKIAPLVTAFGIEFVFNNLLEPTSIELVRKRPDNPQLFEVYDWKNQVVEVQGPITRYNGDFVPGEGDAPDEISRLVNLSCVDNLREQGIAFSNESYEDPATNPCNTAPGGVPLKMRVAEADGSDPKFKSYGGIWGSFGSSCDTPEEGADTCCSRCDYLLGTQVAKYGLSAALSGGESEEQIRALFRKPHIADPAAGGAITCDPMVDDQYIACAGFVPWVNRAEQEQTFRYKFCADGNCEAADYPVPYYDLLRSLHPDVRPEGLERRTAPCTTTAECTAAEGHNLPGTSCVGTTPEGNACNPERTEDCAEAACVAQWFVTCAAAPDTTGAQGYCIDRRFSDRGAGACYRTQETGGGMTYDGRNYGGGDFPALCDEEIRNCQRAPAGTKLAFCDQSEDGALVADECCWPSLQSGLGLEDGRVCDPYFQNVTPVGSYERNENLPESTRDCVCQVPAAEGCEEVVEIGCLDGDGNLRPERAGQFAVKFVTRPGGVVYDPAVKGFEWRPADIGGVPRADIEACAEGRALIGERNIEDGWRANDSFLAENFEEFDRALCSGQEYRVVFSGPDAGQFIEDKVGNTLEGKTEYVFETPQFHVVPGSGFPTDNLRIGACDKFSIRFSNKYDMSPENVAKLAIWEIDADGNYVGTGPVAGGSVCAETDDEVTDSLPPCLTTDIENQGIGELAVQIDPAEFGPILATGRRYRLFVPGLLGADEAADPDAYRNAFWDACGMPLVLGDLDGNAPADYLFDFSIDPPKCKEDQDTDQVQLSCDNAPNFFNPDQGDVDGDGVGDVIDLCPTVPTSSANAADSDKDGIGNECDTCRQTVNQYNEDDANPPDYMLVRNIPFQDDSDGDGIGDACDNCVTVANCEGYGGSNPWQPGDPIPFDDDNLCQQDNDRNMVGDDCAPADPDDFDPDVAAGPIGIAATDDFDQDGLANADDACPRQPVPERIVCETNEDCPEFTKCETAFGVCDHVDTDDDGVGDICDSCAYVQNPTQNVDGFAQEDDDDGDFVGRMCETNAACEVRADPRPFGFYAESSNGVCCTVQLQEDDMGNLVRRIDVPGEALQLIPLADPDALPIRVDCDETSGMCRKLPSSVASRPGVLTLPTGCEGVDPDTNRLQTAEDYGGDLNALWDAMCFLPQFDQDFDGLGDICDLCEFDFDPQNLPFIDGNGKVWPTDGRFCNGEYSIENNKARCPDEEPEPTGGSGGSDGGSGDTGGMDTGGMETGGGTAGTGG